jgi:hypothetical protein
LQDVLGTYIHRENDHADMWIFRNNPARCLDTVESRQRDVHQDHVWPLLSGKLNCFTPVACLAHDLDGSDIGKQSLDTSSQERVVIDK